jgi:UrcA family protein
MSSTCRAIVVAGVCATLFAVQAAAQPIASHGDLSTRTVKYSDADLYSEGGAQRLAARIRYAADYVCGGENLLLRASDRFQRCRREVLQRVTSEVKAPLLAEALRTETTVVASR